MLGVHMRNKKIIIFVVLLVIAVLVFVFKDKLFGASNKIVTDPDSSTENPQHSYLLKHGSTGNQVKLIQAYLKEYRKEDLIVDGIWGDKTQAAFARFSEYGDFINSSGGITKEEYKNIEPHYPYLSHKYFNIK